MFFIDKYNRPQMKGRLVIPAMQIDQNPFPVHTLELTNPQVLIWQNQAESAKEKNVIICEERTEEKVMQKKTPRVAKKKGFNARGPRQEEEDW